MCTELGRSQVEVQSCIAQGRRQKRSTQNPNFFDFSASKVFVHGGFLHADRSTRKRDRERKKHKKDTEKEQKKYILWRFWFQWLKNPDKYLRTVLFHPSCLWCQEIRFFLLYKKTNMFFCAEKCWHTNCFKRRKFYAICVSKRAKGFMRRKCFVSSKPFSFFCFSLSPSCRNMHIFLVPGHVSSDSFR